MAVMDAARARRLEARVNPEQDFHRFGPLGTVGGGVSTVRQYLLAGAIDEMHLAIAPVLLGRGEALFAGLDLPALGFQVRKSVPTEHATHVLLTR